jgi:hypothetical protein
VCAVVCLVSCRDGRLIDRLLGKPPPPIDLDIRSLYFPLDDRAGTINDVPAGLRALDGKTVRVSGFMFSPETIAGSASLYRYHLVYDIPHSHAPPLVQDRIFATASASLPVYDQYTLVDVVGRFSVRLRREDGTGRITTVFGMAVQSATIYPQPVDSPR